MNLKSIKAKFGWTFSGFIYLNLFMVVSLVVTAITGGHNFQKVISVLPKALLIMNAVNFVVMPIVDLFENYKDRKMCSDLNQNYELDFLYTFTVKQKECIRKNFKELSSYAGVTLEKLSTKEVTVGT